MLRASVSASQEKRQLLDQSMPHLFHQNFARGFLVLASGTVSQTAFVLDLEPRIGPWIYLKNHASQIYSGCF